MNRKALAALAILLPALAFVPGLAPAGAKPASKVYYLTVSGHGSATVRTVGPRQDYSTDACSEFRQDTSTARFAATLGKPKHIVDKGPISSFGSHFTMGLRVRLSNGHASYDDATNGSETDKTPGGCSDGFTPSTEKGTCTLTGAAKNENGVVFAVGAKKGRVTIAEDEEGTGLFHHGSGDSCRADSDAGGAGGLLTYPTTVTKLKVAAIKRLGAHHHVTVKGHFVETAGPAEKPSDGTVTRYTVDVSYTITATRVR